jgi:outer membrane protein assembly factor BamB
MDNDLGENVNDIDLGSGGTVVLPDLLNSSGQPMHLAVGAGKDATIYLVNRDSMGKYSENNSNIYQQVAGVLPNLIFSTPAYFNNTVYYGPSGSPIEAFAFGNAKLSANPTAKTPTSFTYPGASPSISANGTSNAILWAVENTNPAVLHAYDATNLNELYNSNQASGGRDQFGTGNKFITPMIANGKVFVGTPNGVAVFGPLP